LRLGYTGAVRRAREGAIPDFARAAVAEQAAYLAAWRKALKGVLAICRGQVLAIDEVVAKVAREQGVERVIVQSAITRLLRRKELREVKPYHLTV
jgi:hypothetical protein